jgi:serine/threonine-protein kinase
MTQDGAGSGRPPSSHGGRYAPGELLVDRYRIVALIGEGGMGEVYLAEDRTLAQDVAIKFLPERLAEREESIERFRQEVRIARTVTHPNVARVHDIGAVDGHPFLTMEYVDGEDLAHLLKRIGRFPREKAVDIAQQLCAGLAAAHARGVVHRDLKPANVMVDGEGRVKITDFGLSMLAGEQERSDAITGTPAYMSPEQIAGGEVTERSEVYSIGLVLYELFTGRRVFDGKTLDDLRRQHSQDAPRTPSSILSEIDPVVERVIMRCLEKDPRARPASVRAVALALPGGDPLAAALAAGETPAPELVAEAGARGGLSVRAALACLVAFLICLAASVVLDRRTQLSAVAPFENPPEVLSRRARDILDRLGLHEPPADSVMQVYRDDEHLADIEQQARSTGSWERLASDRPSIFKLLYRQSPEPLVAREIGPFHSGRASDPPHETPGMVRLWLEPGGDLRGLSIVPPKHVDALQVAPPLDWAPLFAASGLDPATFGSVTPEWTPDVASDARFAWQGPYPGTERMARVEAASFAGRPVCWRVLLPWNLAEAPAESEGVSQSLIVALGVVVLALMLGGTIALARRNVRLKRGDRKGAFRLAVFTLLCEMLTWLAGDHHVASTSELLMFGEILGNAVFLAMIVWLCYLAIEPFLRKLWPERMTSWVRLLDGRWKDPLVGRDVLVAALLGTGMSLIGQLGEVIPDWVGRPVISPAETGFTWIEQASLLGGRQFLAVITGSLSASLGNALLLVALLVVLRLLLRRLWLAALMLLLITSLFDASSNGWVVFVTGVAMTGLWLFALLRLGLLGAVAASQVHFWTTGLPMILDGSNWFLTSSVIGLVLILAFALWGFVAALAGRPIFAEPDGG